MRGTSGGVVEPSLDLAKGDEDAAAATNDPEFSDHVLVEVVAADAEDAGCFVGTEREARAELLAGFGCSLLRRWRGDSGRSIGATSSRSCCASVFRAISGLYQISQAC